MIDYNIAYYGTNTYDYTCNSYTPSGVAVSDIWGLYNPYDPANDAKRGKPLDESIYVWHIGAGSAYGTNACISLARSSTLNMEVKTDGLTTPTPAAICAYNYGFDGQSLNSDRGFRVDPSIRLAYDITKDDGVGGWGKSCLLCDINPLMWCVYPEMAVYSYNTHSIGTFRTLSNIVSYLNNDPSRRVTTIRNYLYRGAETRTSSPSLWDDDGSTIEETPVMGLLKERPICDNLQSSLGAYIKNGQDYESDRVYNPFNQANTTYFFRSAGRVEGNARQHDIGFAIQIQANSIISGHDLIPDSYGRCTAFFAHFSDKTQVFDDVSYHWRYCLYDETIDRELPEGYDLSNITTHSLRIMSVLEIDDSGDYATYGEAVKAAILHEVAYIGFYFVDTTAKAESDPLGSASTGVGVYLPEKVEGVTTGRYFTGDEIKNVPYADNTNTADFEYKGYNPEDGETGDFVSRTNSGSIGCGVSYYSLNAVQVNALCTWLNTTYTPTDEDTFIQDFKGVNPGEYITAMMFYPFEIPHAGSDIEIVIGKLGSGVNGFPLNYTYGNFINFDSYTFPRYGDFRDTLMTISVTVPFCGTRELDPRLWAGRTLNLRMSIDYPTGAVTVYFYRDEYCMDSISGSVGVPLPLSAVANGSYQVAITNLLASHKAAYRNTVMSSLGVAGGVGSMIAGAASGNIKLALGGALSTITGVSGMDANADKMDNIDYNIDHTAPAVSEVQGGSPFINCGQDYRAKVLICTPKFLPGYNAAVYAKTTGHATAKQGELSKISKGFTRCASADLSGIKATSTERQMIYELLQGGVIV